MHYSVSSFLSSLFFIFSCVASGLLTIWCLDSTIIFLSVIGISINVCILIAMAGICLFHSWLYSPWHKKHLWSCRVKVHRIHSHPFCLLGQFLYNDSNFQLFHKILKYIFDFPFFCSTLLYVCLCILASSSVLIHRGLEHFGLTITTFWVAERSCTFSKTSTKGHFLNLQWVWISTASILYSWLLLSSWASIFCLP